jgi:glycosyltransferase involved in cell wall biosynthesis
MNNSQKISKRLIIVTNSASNLLSFRGRLIKELIDKNFQVLVIIPDSDFSIDFEKNVLKLGAKISTIPLDRAGLNPFRDFLTYLALKSSFKKFKPDIVLSYTSKPIIYSGLAIGKNPKIKFFPNLTGLGYGFTEKFELKRKLINVILKSLYKLSLRFSTAVIFQNPDDELLFDNLNITKDRKTFIVNGSGVDLKFYSRTSLPSKPIFLMLSRLVADKGVIEYCEAAKEIRDKFPDVIFQLAGSFDPNPSGLKYDQLKPFIDAKDIEYLGHIKDVREILNRCRYYVLPSYREGTPRSVLEAMSIGRPIITTNTTGCKETVLNGINGLLITPKDKDSLVIAIQKMLKLDDKKVNEMANESIKLVSEKYDVRKVNQHIIEIINN